jgi:hypothetical protein
MPVTAQSIITDSALSLLDETNVAWPETELLGYLNSGILEAARIRPDLFVVSVPIALVAGASQSIPADGYGFITAIKNTAGQAVSEIDEAELSNFLPAWESLTPTQDVVHFMPDAVSPRLFKVYPPNDATGSLDVKYSKIPTILLIGDNIQMPDEYKEALRAYVMYRALSKETESQDNAKAGGYLGMFTSILGGSE